MIKAPAAPSLSGVVVISPNSSKTKLFTNETGNYNFDEVRDHYIPMTLVRGDVASASAMVPESSRVRK